MGWFRTPVCSHTSHDSKFMDFHSGGDGEIYVRSYSQCRDCTHGWYAAVRLPDIAAAVLNENMHLGTIERKPSNVRSQVEYAVENVYYDIDKRAICTAVNKIIHEEIKKAFRKN